MVRAEVSSKQRKALKEEATNLKQSLSDSLIKSDGICKRKGPLNLADCLSDK